LSRPFTDDPNVLLSIAVPYSLRQELAARATSQHESLSALARKGLRHFVDCEDEKGGPTEATTAAKSLA
jgi:hypothetical protein